MFSTVFKDDDDVVIGKVFMQVWERASWRKGLGFELLPSCLLTGLWAARYWPSLLDTSSPVLKIIATGCVVMAAVGILSHGSAVCVFSCGQGSCSGFELFPTSIAHSLQLSFIGQQGGVK